MVLIIKCMLLYIVELSTKYFMSFHCSTMIGLHALKCQHVLKQAWIYKNRECCSGGHYWNLYSGAGALLLSTMIQSCAIIMFSNITWYCIYHYSDWGRMQHGIWIHKRHPMPHPDRQAMSFVRILEKIDHIISAPHCISRNSSCWAT